MLIKMHLSAARTESTVGPEEQGHMKSNLAVFGPGKKKTHLEPLKILYLLWEFNYRISFPYDILGYFLWCGSLENSLG